MSMEFTAAYPPKPHRTHEVCGPGAPFFAFALAAHSGGTVLWIRGRWLNAELNPSGFFPILNPGDLLVATGKDQTEILAVAEESLRSNAVKLVVMELTKPLDLTAGRRLQLAAKQGKTQALAIIPEGMGSNAAETRWRCKPIFNPAGLTYQRWELIKNKSGTLGGWNVRWNHETRLIALVPPAGERPGSKGMPD